VTDYSTGDCPDDEPIDLAVVQHEDADDEVSRYLQRASERGRREIVLGSIRAHLLEQPTATAVKSATRHWIADLAALGEEVAKTKRRNTG
jgi:hypothetical protein